MFCLDFAFAFALHAIATRALKKQEYFLSDGRNVGWIFCSSVASGFGSACLLYPFDIVRQTVVPGSHTSFAFSTVPYMGVYMGLYFTLRDEKASNLQKLALAAGSSTAAAAAELPFDKAKLAISGSTRMAMITTGLRIPLASLLLVSYDHMLLSKYAKESRT